MSKIKLTGENSGYVEISAGQNAGNNTLEAPTSGTRLVAHEGTQDVVLGGNLTVNGVLTYEDVTNIDAVGVITARSGIHVTGGSVGIGTDNPGGLLHISSGTSGDATLILEADIDNNDEGDNPKILFRQDGGNDWSAIGNGLNVAGGSGNNALILANSVGDANGGIIFQTGAANGYTNASERLRITSGGNIGIGTDIVTQPFEVWAGTATTSFAIDSSGRVTMPYQPYARASSNTTQAATNAIPLNQYNLSRGGITISGNRFTVPVAGAYVFGYHHLGNAGSGSCQMEIRHNGTYVSGTRTQNTANSNDSFGTQTIKELNASDYIEFWVTLGAAHGNPDFNSMWIWLLG